MLTVQNILVGIDVSDPLSQVVERAAQLAEVQRASLTLVDGLPQLTWAQRMSWNEANHVQELLLREKTARLKKLAASLRKRGLTVKYKVLVGRAPEELIRQVLRGKHDLLMRGTKGPASVRPGPFSSTAMELLRKCPCPVWLVHPRQEGPLQQVLATVDTNPEKVSHAPLDERILTAAMAIGQAFHATVDALHVWSIYGERIVRDYMKTDEFEALQAAMYREHGDCLRDLVTRVGFSGGAEHVHLVRGDATVEIPKFAREHGTDLLVMGTLARAGVAGLLMGNTAELILHQVDCSVLAFKPPGFVSPVKARPAAAAVPEVAHLPPILPQPPLP